MLRTVTALPGDARFGHLPHDVDEDYLSALTGFFTDMDMMGWLDRPVTYTPLKLPSIYAGVIGANACAAALVDRLRCGEGREVHASRIAGGLSAIGALCRALAVRYASVPEGKQRDALPPPTLLPAVKPGDWNCCMRSTRRGSTSEPPDKSNSRVTWPGHVARLFF